MDKILNRQLDNFKEVDLACQQSNFFYQPHTCSEKMLTDGGSHSKGKSTIGLSLFSTFYKRVMLFFMQRVLSILFVSS